MRAPKGSIQVGSLIVSPNDFALVRPNGESVDDVPYIVFAVTASPDRHDWFLIPELQKAHANLRTAVKAGKPDEAKDALITFERTTITSDDLLAKDALRINQEVRKEVELAFPTAETAAAGSRDISPLSEIRIYA